MGPGDGDRTKVFGGEPWRVESKRIERALIEALDFPALTPDISFVAFLKACSQFGFFRFGPVTIDVEVVEDILLRTHPRGEGGPEYPLASEESIALGKLGWGLFGDSTVGPVGQRETLLTFLQWGKGLPARVFGELGVTAQDVERYISELSSGARGTRPASRRLLTTDEAAEYLGVHVQTIRAWIRSGKLPASRLAGMKSIRIREADLEAVLEPIDPNAAED